MSWIKIDTGIRVHAKVLKLARLTNEHPLTAVGFLVSFWGWAVDNAPDGILDATEFETIARELGWPGDCANLAKTLISCGRNGGDGLLEQREDGSLLIHDWKEWAGAYIKERELARQRMKRKRERDSGVTRTLRERYAARRKKEEGRY